MKRTIFDALIVVIGAILTPWAILKWSELRFRLEPKFYAGNRDGSLFLIAAAIGIALIAYGIFNITVLRRK